MCMFSRRGRVILSMTEEKLMVDKKKIKIDKKKTNRKISERG